MAGMAGTALLRASVTDAADGAQVGDSAQVLIDGADTPVTANGLPDYLPTPGDRLLVQRVGQQMEIVQFLSRGTVPYVSGEDLSDLAAQVSLNSDDIDTNSDTVSTLGDSFSTYTANNDATIATLQPAFSALSGVGDVGVIEDYMWVGDDPALQTVKAVQISPYVQGGLYAGDYPTFSAYFNLWDQNDIGDVTFSETVDPPMTTFYNVFTANGREAVAWNA